MSRLLEFVRRTQPMPTEPLPTERIMSMFKSKHENSHLFKIEKFSLLNKYKIKMVESSIFNLGGDKWKLFVYPRGDKNGNGYVSIFLENQFPINRGVRFELFVVNQLYSTVYHSSGVNGFFGNTSTTPTKRGTSKLISLVDLKKDGYHIRDCCIFGVKISGIYSEECGTAECFSLIEKPDDHKVTWRISKFSSFDPERPHRSKVFEVGTRKWQIEVHPRGDSEEKDKSFSVYLCGEGFINNVPKAKTFAKFKLTVFDQVNENHTEIEGSDWFDHKKESSGYPDFIPLEELEPYLMKNKLYVGVEFKVISVTKYC